MMNAYAIILTVALNGTDESFKLENAFVLNGWYQEKTHCLADAQKEQKRLQEMAGYTGSIFYCVPIGKKYWFNRLDKLD